MDVTPYESPAASIFLFLVDSWELVMRLADALAGRR
jgi:hypothetical protein